MKYNNNNDDNNNNNKTQQHNTPHTKKEMEEASEIETNHSI